MGKQELIGVLWLMLFFALPLTCCNGQELSRQEIMQIAINKAEELGYATEETVVVYDEGNLALKDCFLREGVSIYDEENDEWVPQGSSTPEAEIPSLKNRNYQTVYFRTEELVLGGDLWILIDKDTGEVISWMIAE
ncbi:MAG: hypothetical protein PVI33_04655 [Candidatus Omnitrophota bacterium]|jgi:hypothetical protein